MNHDRPKKSRDICVREIARGYRATICEKDHERDAHVRYAGGDSVGGAGMNDIGDDTDTTSRLFHLRVEHRDLDMAIAALADGGAADQLQMMRLKKRKLRLRDEISALEDRLIPDIIA